MPHFSEYSAVRGGDSFNGADRIVGIEADVAGCVSVQIHILRGDLTVCRELSHKLLAAQEAALAVGNGNQRGGREKSSFAVGNRDTENIAYIGQCQPRGTVGNDAGPYNP